MKAKHATNNDIVLVYVDWSDEKSITTAEVLKAKLENQCYRLLTTSSGLDDAVLVYILD